MEALFAHFLDCHPSRRSFVGALAVLGLGSAGTAAARETSELTGSTYLFAEITLKPGTVQKFAAVLGEVAALLEKHGGWKLQGCFLEADGKEDKIIDVWEIPNAAAVQKGLGSLPTDPAFESLGRRLQECVESETLHLMDRQPVTIG